MALAPQLRFGQADAARDAQALRAMVPAALAFTPMVTLDAEATLPGVLLEVRSSLRYFCGLSTLQQRLRAALAPLGFSFRMASAPTALGAALLARWRQGFELGAQIDDLSQQRERLDDAPVWLLGPGREHWDALQGMGLRCLGGLRWLPRTGLDRARGDCPDPRGPVVPEPRFEAGSSSSSVPTAASRCCRARRCCWRSWWPGRRRSTRASAALRWPCAMSGGIAAIPKRPSTPSCRSRWPKPRTMRSSCSCCCANG